MLWSLEVQSDIDAPIGKPRAYGDPSAWIPTTGFQKEADCEDRRTYLNRSEQLFVEKATKEASKQSKTPRLINQTVFKCLPDTVDPRGPKSK